MDPYTADTRAEKNTTLLGPDSTMTDAVRIARWDSAYTGPPNYNVRNGPAPSNHFIDRDPERFYTRIRDCAADADPTARDSITATLATQSPNGSDAPTELTLTETDTSSGTFRSEAQMLTTRDLPGAVNADDNFQAQSPSAGGPVADDTLDDRTHRARLEGHAILDYDFGGSASLTDSAAVCHPDSVRTLEVEVVVFKEPYKDVGYITAAGDTMGANNGAFDFLDSNGDGIQDAGERSEPYLDFSTATSPSNIVWRRGENPNVTDGRGGVATESEVQSQIERADIAWAQACVDVRQKGSTTFADAPQADGKNILGDNKRFDPRKDAQAVYQAYQAQISKNVAHVFFAGWMKNAYAIAYPPFVSSITNNGADSFTVLRSNLDISHRTLAHEIGHLLTNRNDDWNRSTPNIRDNQPQTIFFPAYHTYRDVNVNKYRRITRDTETNARSVRPTGNLNAVGNRLLQKQ